ncbi:MAG: peptide ABC transporter substrate-binding protein [Phycisphaerales bacterium]|nr:peptide ABC transporter substrate-binding protein [Phycisphaerales bacterium]
MGKLIAIFALLVGVLALTLAMDRSIPEADFTYIQPQDIFTLDPQAMSYNQDLRMAYAIYEPLAHWDNEVATFDIIPAAAERWEISDDGLTYTFHIRDAARWSNGDPVLAEDFRYAWQRAIMPDSVADYSGLFFVIDGAEAFFDWRTEALEAYAERPASQRTREAALALREETNQRFADTVGIRTLDDHTLEVRLARPTAYFLDLCAFGPFCPVHPETVEKFVTVKPESGRLDTDKRWTKPWNLVCNGPYVVEQWQFKRGMFLRRNPQYWDQDAIVSDTIRTLPVQDGNTSILAYETGAASWHSDVTVKYIADMLAQKREGKRDDIHALSTFGTYFWSFNCRPKLSDGRDNPFHDAGVRRAFALSVDKQAIVEKVKRSGEKVAHVLIPPGSIGGFESPQGLRLDPVRAREELAKAGWADRDGNGVPENESGVEFPVVEMLCSTGSYHEDIAMAMGRMFTEVLGVRTRIEAKESKIYKDDLKQKDYMMARGGWFGDYGDPTTFLDLHRTGDGNNDRGYSDPVFDDLLARAAQEPDVDKRMTLLEEAERYTMEDTLPVLPIWHYNYYYMFEPPLDDEGHVRPGGLVGISYHPRLVQYMWKLGVLKEGDEVRVTEMGVFAQ